MEKGSVLTANSSPFVFGNTSSPSIASYTPETQQQHPSLTGTRTALPEKARPQRPASPLFSISTEFDSEQVQGTFGELTSKILLAAGVPSTRTLSPSPLLWGEGGWDAGHFAFGEGGDLSKLAFSDGGGGSEGGSGRIDSSANSLPESADSGYGSTVGGGDSLVVDNGLKAAGTTPRLSALVPTATPFVFHPKAPTAGGRLPPSSSLHLNFNHSPAPVPTHLPLPIPPPFTLGGSTWYATPPSPLAQPYTSPSAPQVELPPAQASTSGGWTFDGQGHLVAGQGEAKYTIADEILQLQSTPFAQGGRDVAFASTEIDESRMRQVQHQRSFDGWQSQSQQPYPPTPPSSTPSDLRSRSSSLASVGSYFSPQPPAERSPATAQLQSYFGPAPNASIDVSDAFLHHPLSALQTDPEDLLYTLARQTFVSQSLPISSAAPATPAQCLAMNTHFDRAMHSPNPLATLYGLSPEQANRLAEEPGTSGVSECVLRLAKSRAAMFAGGGREGGPSPNNRKLGLYKTELCRSWEEKGSCRYGTRCQFAHGAQEVRSVARHPKFKSEVCRTFWLHGSCPYGRRCCFIHTTVAGGLPTGPPPDSLTHALSSMSMEPVPDTPPRQISRLARLARLSSLSSMTPIQPGSFGPALANYLGPGSTASSSTMTAYSTASAYLNERFKGDVNDVLFSQDLGAGIKSAGRFTHNPSEVPATYQDPPQSRLRRLAAQGPSQSTYAVERFDSSYPSEPACIATSSPIGRHHSNQSNGSNVSSSTASSYPGFSPFIPRVSSTSSVSSYGGASAYDGACPLQPAGNDWLGGSSSTSARNGALDWSSAEDDEGSTAGRLLERDFGGLSLAIDRSSEMTPRGQRVV